MATPSSPDYAAGQGKEQNAGHRSAGLKQEQQSALPTGADGITVVLKQRQGIGSYTFAGFGHKLST